MTKEQQMSELSVKIAFDPKAKVWVTWDSQVPGLTAIDDTKKGLVDQIEQVVPELLEMSRDSTRLVRDKQYNIVVFEQAPPASIEQPVTRPEHRAKSFSVEPHS